MLVTGRAVERWYICNHCVKETSVNYSTISHWYALTLMTIPPVLYLTLPWAVFLRFASGASFHSPVCFDTCISSTLAVVTNLWLGYLGIRHHTLKIAQYIHTKRVCSSSCNLVTFIGILAYCKRCLINKMDLVGLGFILTYLPYVLFVQPECILLTSHNTLIETATGSNATANFFPPSGISNCWSWSWSKIDFENKIYLCGCAIIFILLSL